MQVLRITEPLDSNDIVITGFRASLNKALDVKRESVSSVDAIVAEDIGKFPDPNLAESLQRIPGMSIQRAGSAPAGPSPAGSPESRG